MDYSESLQYLDSLTNYERRDNYDYGASFKLERMKRLVSRLGNPQKSFLSIHVAGSKGKGSTSAFIYSILKCAGLKTGLYTSPHLSSFRERIKIDDEMIPEEDIARLTGIIKEAAGADKNDVPTFFEACTAMAFMYFKEKGIDIGVFEVGLGGRLDATNVLEPGVCVITPISYEHTDKLGATLTQIAGEKAGIIKNNSICVVAPQDDEAMNMISDICRKKNAKIVIVGRDIKYELLKSSDRLEEFDIIAGRRSYAGLSTSLLGKHQVVNAAAAIGAVLELRSSRIEVSEYAIRNGVSDTKWPGRLEVVSREPYIVLDAAHNGSSASALASAVKRAFSYNKLVLVLGVSKDKDVEGILRPLVPIADTVILTKSNVQSRALDPDKIYGLIGDNKKSVVITESVEDALVKAQECSDKDGMILITGSLFVVGEARQILCQK